MLHRTAGIILSALGIFFFWYGWKVCRIASGSTFYRIWYLGGAVCLILGVLHWFAVPKQIPRWFQIGVLAIVLLGVISLVAIETLIISSFEHGDAKSCDVLIVCGAQIRGYEPSVILLQRLTRAKEYLNEYPDTICIVSGGQGENEPCAEAELMKNWLVKEGIDETRIITESESLNTDGNMKYSKKLLPEGCESVGILTSNFHLFRASELAKSCGIPVTVTVGADSNPFYLPHNLLREYCGVVKDFLVGNLHPAD